MPSLTIITGDQAGKQFLLAKRPLSIGRDPARDIQILDPKVSRKHALLRHEVDGHLIAPAKALNGLIINGETVTEETRLADGDRLQLGDTELAYSVSDDPDRTNALHQRKQADRQHRENNTIM